ncbi:hypothetical protein [Streptomyces sp. NBC_00986]|uniref:hypothetical protein n=1 Tax=Streptomyces sp. NBC_00986 TaxID=2903702 RepID=UPI003867A6B9|nr:hypothetical protein OG504_34940 [Streptomyces sp. NBC_00986]
MEAVITVFALLFLLFVVVGSYAAIKAVGAAKRGVDRTVAQARRSVEDHTLRAKSFAQPGPQGQVAQLRLALRTSMRATQDALRAGVPEDESLKESLGLFERLSAHGRELDGELRRLESEPDRKTLTERLPALRERTERITKSADSLRWAARDRAGRFAEDDLDTLSAQIDMEAGALRHWTKSEHTTPPWPDPPPADAAAGRQTWPEPPRSRPADEEPAPSAITPPGRRPSYPWQKKPRPESTT